MYLTLGYSFVLSHSSNEPMVLRKHVYIERRKEYLRLYYSNAYSMMMNPDRRLTMGEMVTQRVARSAISRSSAPLQGATRG